MLWKRTMHASKPGQCIVFLKRTLCYVFAVREQLLVSEQGQCLELEPEHLIGFEQEHVFVFKQEQCLHITLFFFARSVGPQAMSSLSPE